MLPTHGAREVVLLQATYGYSRSGSARATSTPSHEQLRKAWSSPPKRCKDSFTLFSTQWKANSISFAFPRVTYRGRTCVPSVRACGEANDIKKFYHTHIVFLVPLYWP